MMSQRDDSDEDQMLFRRQHTTATKSTGLSAADIAPPFPGDGPPAAERATFAAGCFWGVEAAFRETDGVLQTSVGYTDGHTRRSPPTSRSAATPRGTPKLSRCGAIPPASATSNCSRPSGRSTTRNRQGLDVGSQYRSAIFFHSPEQSASSDREQHKRRRQIVTGIVPASALYRAEEY